MENACSLNNESENEESCPSDSFIELNSSDMITLEDELRQIFTKFSCNLNVVHINAQSITAHYLPLLATFTSLYNIDAILVSETFLKHSMNSNLIDLPGFNLIRNDRMEKGCGGVAIYLRKDIKYQILHQSPNKYSQSAEYLFIEIFHEETKALLGVFYSPSSKIDYFPSFEAVLKKYRSAYKHVFILGDFNTNLLKRNSRSKTLISIIDDHELNILPLGETHFPPRSVPSALDLIIVSNLDNIDKFGQLPSYFSYHDIVYVSYKLEHWREREVFTNTAVISNQSSDIQPFWHKTSVRQALAQQLKALKIYKQSNRGDEDLKEYQRSREELKILDKEFKREIRKIQKSQQKLP